MRPLFPRTLRTLRLLFLGASALVVVVFSIVNRERVEVSLFPLPYALDTPKFMLVLIAFALGALVAYLLLSRRIVQSKRLIKHEHKQVEALKNEVQALKLEKHNP